MNFNNKKFLRIPSVAIALFLSLFLFSPSYAALPNARSAEVSGDVFLGGEYIELGISRYGSFGTDEDKPVGFFGTDLRNNIGMSSDLDGFDTGTDWRMDYFMPGTEEERWSVGYTVGGTRTTASNAKLQGSTGIANNTVSNQSSGDNLRAVSTGSLNSLIEIKQDITFNKSDKFFKNTVILKNISTETTLDSVRFMRSFDPDNTVDQGGDYETRNTILFTHAAGDGKAVVQADTSNSDTDPVYLGTGGASGGTRSPIVYYSSDTRARVAFHNGLNPGTVYTAAVYDTVQAKGSTVDRDGAISIAFDVGTLAPGESETFTYYTSLDNRDFSEVISEIEQDESVTVENPTNQTQSKVVKKRSSSSFPVCSALKPHNAPDLFQIDVVNDKAVLYLAPSSGPVTKYIISYGYTAGDERFGTQFAHGHSTGVISHTVNDLDVNSTYYFKVRAGNDCMPGEWSNEMKITTAKSATGAISYYKSFVQKILSYLPAGY